MINRKGEEIQRNTKEEQTAPGLMKKDEGNEEGRRERK